MKARTKKKIDKVNRAIRILLIITLCFVVITNFEAIAVNRVLEIYKSNIKYDENLSGIVNQIKNSCLNYSNNSDYSEMVYKFCVYSKLENYMSKFKYEQVSAVDKYLFLNLEPSEIAKEMKGDCTKIAILFASLVKTANITDEVYLMLQDEHVCVMTKLKENYLFYNCFDNMPFEYLKRV